MIDEHQKRSGLYFASKVVLGWLPCWLAALLAPLLTGPYHEGSDRTVRDVLKSLFPENARLRGLLAYHWGQSCPAAMLSFHTKSGLCELLDLLSIANGCGPIPYQVTMASALRSHPGQSTAWL